MNLDELRVKIDQLDGELLRLFEERMDIVSDVGEYKRDKGLPVLDRKREAEKLGGLRGKVRQDLEPYAHTLFSTLFRLGRSYQLDAQKPFLSLHQEIKDAAANTQRNFPQDATVACPGVEGAFSELACDKLFGRPSIQYFKTFDNIASAVESGFCEYGVLPFENSTAGSVNKIYELLQSRNLKIVRSVRQKIVHHMMTAEGVMKEDVREIFSHEQAILQCSKFLEELAQVKITMCENTAIAAKMVADSGRRDVAAICSLKCADLYGLKSLAKNIQDEDNNYTRFICVSKRLEIYADATRTSIIMVLPHQAGSLYKAVSKFNESGFNLTKLESRPLGDSNFMFYLDFEASPYCDEFTVFMDEMQEFCEEFKYLGSYTEVV